MKIDKIIYFFSHLRYNIKIQTLEEVCVRETAQKSRSFVEVWQMKVFLVEDEIIM